MKKLLVILFVSFIVMSMPIRVFAQAVVPEQSVGNVNMSSHDGLHRAHRNVMENNETASQMFHIRFMPAFHDHH